MPNPLGNVRPMRGTGLRFSLCKAHLCKVEQVKATDVEINEYLQLIFVTNIFGQIFHQPLEAALKQINFTNQIQRIAIGASALALALLAGCATEAPKTVEAPQPAPVAQAPVAPSAPAPVAPTPAPKPVQPAANSAYFDFDKAEIKDDSTAAVRANADYLMQTNDRVVIEGNADERGSREYNMALGQKRAEAVKRALTTMGVKADRIETISNGEDKPKASGHDEKSWAENRRADIVKK